MKRNTSEDESQSQSTLIIVDCVECDEVISLTQTEDLGWIVCDNYERCMCTAHCDKCRNTSPSDADLHYICDTCTKANAAQMKLRRK